MKTYKRSTTVERLADGFVVLSTEAPCDRDGLILSADGWDLSRWAKVPMKMAYNHDTYDMPIGRWEDLQVRGKKLVAKPVFASDEDPARAGVIAKLWDGGFLDDTSISFRVDGTKLVGPVKVKGRDYMQSMSHAPFEASVVFMGADPNSGKGRIAEAVTRGIITEDEAHAFDPEVTPDAEPWREENAELRTQVETLTKGLETLTDALDRLREETARAAPPAAPVTDPSPQRTDPEPGPITLDTEAIGRMVRDAVNEAVKRAVHEALCFATGRLPD